MVQEVLDVMISLARDGMTMLVVTHEMGFARQAANRVVFMADGAVVEQRHPDEFFTNPGTDRARDFLSKILHTEGGCHACPSYWCSPVDRRTRSAASLTRAAGDDKFVIGVKFDQPGLGLKRPTAR